MPRGRWPLVLLLGALCITCDEPVGDDVRSSAPAGSAPPPVLEFELSTGAPIEPPAPPRVETRPLPPERTRALLAQLPALASAPGDRAAIALRPGSPPPPRKGDVVTQAFPPAESRDRAPEAESGPLRVLRFSPEGEVAIARGLSLTFSQPMIALGATRTDAAAPPVALSPDVPGRWRWIGTRTLVFESDPRLPMATEFTATVAAGTRSATGGSLAEETRWSFATPPPSVVSIHPPTEVPQPIEPVLFVSFDQAIDRDALLTHVRLTSDQMEHALRLATADEIDEDETVRELVKDATASGRDARWLALRPRSPLPADTSFELTIGAGAPSGEGPRRTTAATTHRFSTFAAFALVAAGCDGPCYPGSPWRIQFNNPIDPTSFEPGDLSIEPEVPDVQMIVGGYDNAIWIQGEKRPDTAHTLRLPAALEDRFGQRLGETKPIRIEVGDFAPELSGPSRLVTLDAKNPPRLRVTSINAPQLRVRAQRVAIADFEAFTRGADVPQRRGPAIDRIIDVDGPANTRIATDIDLETVLTGGIGHAIVEVSSVATPEWQRVKSWVTGTNIGLDVFADSERVHAWVTALADGAPRADVEIEVGDSKATSGADGLAAVDVADADLERPGLVVASLVIARQGRDSAFVPLWLDPGGSYATESRWFVFDDRGVYRPGEAVHMKGWVRKIDRRADESISTFGDEPARLEYRVVGPRGNPMAEGSTEIGPGGGFDLRFELPSEANLGFGRVELTTSVGTGEHTFRIEEFRRPEFEVSVTPDSAPHFVGTTAALAGSADYFAGGGLANAPIEWSVRATPGQFTPPGWSDWTFGEWIPWWEQRGGGADLEARDARTLASRTDAQGDATLRIDLVRANPPRPATLDVTARVTDVNRQEQSGSARLLVHPANRYVGLRMESTFVAKDTPLEVRWVVTDLDGGVRAGHETILRAHRVRWTQRNGEWVETEEDPQMCEAVSGEEPSACTFETPRGGRYRITATTRDASGRENQTRQDAWVAGETAMRPGPVAQDAIELIPDKAEYRPGDTAKILARLPFSPAEALVSYRRDGIRRLQRLRIEGPTETIEIPIEAAFTPNLWIGVDVVGARPGEDTDASPSPAIASGSINLAIPPYHRTLRVTPTPETAELPPGRETVVDVEVADPDGEPVNGAEVAVWIVDEAVLSLTSYETPDPLATFYFERFPETQDTHNRTTLERVTREADPELGLAAMSFDAAPEVRMSRRGKGTGSPEIALRTDFDPLAVFSPEGRTDERGRLRVPVKLPDNVTRYRVMAVAVSGERWFGSGESAITARLPLVVRPSPPRFLNFGDRFSFPVVLQNQTGEAVQVELAARAANAAFTEAAGRSLTVGANDRVEVLLPAAAEDPGTARFQMIAASRDGGDAVALELPVYTPATTEAFAAYGEIDTSMIRQPIVRPENAAAGFGELSITLASTQLQALTDALLYLTSYPYECSEQLASRMLGVVALRDVLGAFGAEDLPDPKALAEAVARDVDTLVERQNPDGSFGLWKAGDREWPFMSVHVTHALARAQSAGYEVPESTLRAAGQYLSRIEQRIPDRYPPIARNAVLAYALFVRNELGEGDPVRARALVRKPGLDALGAESVGWLLSSLAKNPDAGDEIASIRRWLDNRVTETAGNATFATDYTDGEQVLLHSNRRADAIVLAALISDRPESDLAAKLTRGLLASRKRGRWTNTQENVFVLLALERYFRTYESATPDFVARTWLGEGYAGERRFAGRETERTRIEIPLDEVDGRQELAIEKQGTGRLYYRLGLVYAPQDLDLDPLANGFAVARKYEAVDDPADVTRADDGTWRIRAGAEVRVTVTLVAESRRHHVALVDPLPAGLEVRDTPQPGFGFPIDVRFASRPFWLPSWYEHVNARDERVEVFATELPAGVYTYGYVAAATTPGTFVTPPTKAEEMYAPETFGRAGTDRVVVE